MGCMVLLEIQVKPECIADAKKMFKDNLGDTRAYDGCQSIDVYDNMDKGGNLVIYEKWDSRPQYEKYLAWRTESGTMDVLAQMIEGEPSIRFFDRVDA